MDVIDPSLRSIACDACWRGVFSPAGWHAVLAGKEVPGHIGFAKGYGYKTTWATVRAAAARGRVLLNKYYSLTDESNFYRVAMSTYPPSFLLILC